MTDTQEAMREEFEKSKARHFTAFVDLSEQDDCNPETAFNFAYLAAWQAATAQSAEKMARLETAVLNQMIFRAAAELSNKQLRDGIETIAIKASGGLCQFGLDGKHAFLRDIKNLADKFLSKP